MAEVCALLNAFLVFMMKMMLLLWLQYKLLSYAHYFKNSDDITCIIVNVRMVFGKTILFATELDSLSRMALLLL